MKKFSADFETATWLTDETYVWAWALCNIDDENDLRIGNSIESFFEEIQKENCTLWFHNLKFDGEFILYYLLKNGYERIENKKDRKDKTFMTLISDMGLFYSMEIYFKVGNKSCKKVTIYDSLKILPFSVDVIAKTFGLPIRKLELDYDTPREKGYVLKDYEKDYITNDVKIVALALKEMFDENLTKMTIGSNALSNYKESKGVLTFSRLFPSLNRELYEDLKNAYKGGFTYLNPIYKEVENGSTVILDVNSLYPSVMTGEYLPFGDPIYFIGKYEEDPLYKLYIQTLTCSFELKEGKIPTIQIKNNLAFVPNEYVKSSDGDLVTLTLTNVDLKLFFENYDVKNITYHSGWKFKALKGLFTNYISYWTEKKINAKKEGNNVLYLISKLMLNSLYGKFGLNPNVGSKFPYLNEEGVVKYGNYPMEIRDSVYLPVATFVTSLARRKTILTSQAIKDYTLKNYGKDYYIYSDTDSIHLLDMEEEKLKSFVEIDDYKLGAWKLESKFKKGKYIRQKCYIEEGYDDKLNVVIAGLPKKLGNIINFDNFKVGFTTENMDIKEKKLTFKHVKGGVLLVNTDFTIK